MGKPNHSGAAPPLAGDAVDTIALGEFAKPTFFVEDLAHSEFIGALASLLQADVASSRCGTASNVRSLFQHQRASGGWPNTYFLTDGDNEGHPFPGDVQFCHLPVYAVENLFLDPEMLATVLNLTIDEVRQLVLDCILLRKDIIFRKNKFFEFLAEKLEVSHITYARLGALDGSLILDSLLQSKGRARGDFIREYLALAHSKGTLGAIVPSSLLAAMTKKP